MSMMKNMAVFGLSICFLAMSIPVMAADEVKNEEIPTQMREESEPMKNMLATLVVNGTISEETYAALEEYFKDNRPAQPTKAEFDGERPELPDGAEFDGERPELPDRAEFDGERPKIPEGAEIDGAEPSAKPMPMKFATRLSHRMPEPMPTSEMLQAVLEEGIITLEEYEEIIESLPIMPSLPSENE